MKYTAQKKYSYRIKVNEQIDEDGKAIAVYGIEAWADHSHSLICTVENVFTLYTQTEELVKLCNTLQLDPGHLTDVIEDALVK